MKFGLFAFGTRGDVDPFLSLAIGLSKLGYNVIVGLITPYEGDYDFYRKEYNLNILQGFDVKWYHEIKQSKEFQDEEFIKSLGDVNKDIVYPMAKKICSESDVIIGLEGNFYLQAYSEIFNIQYVTLSYQHSLIPTEYRPFILHESWTNGSKESNLLSWKKVEDYLNEMHNEQVSTFRKEIGIKPIKNIYRQITHSPILNIIGVSKVFCQQFNDWEGHRYVCGHLALEKNTEIVPLPKALDSFIESGKPPIFLNLGSTNFRASHQRTIIKAALIANKKLKRNMVIQANWAELQNDEFNIDNRIFKVEGFIDYSLLLPKCALSIYHGGAGTTHITTLNGCISIIIESGADTGFWAHELERLGVAPKRIQLNEVTEDNLYDRLKIALDNKEMKDNALRLRKSMLSENGVNKAVKVIERKFKLVKEPAL